MKYYMHFTSKSRLGPSIFALSHFTLKARTRFLERLALFHVGELCRTRQAGIDRETERSGSTRANYILPQFHQKERLYDDNYKTTSIMDTY